MGVNTTGGNQIDGRAERRERGRLAVLDAVVDLIEETSALPGTAAIAERAGVSSASLFRYFDSIDDMQHEATIHHFNRNREFYEIPAIGEGSLTERIERLSDARIRLHSRTAPVARFGRTRVLEIPYMADGIRMVRKLNVRQNRQHFAPELAAMPTERAEETVLGIATLTSFESWDQLTRDLGRDNDFVRSCWVDTLTRLFSI